MDDYDQITVTPYSYRDDSLNPNFKVVYTNPDCGQISPAPETFVYYTLNSGEKAGFEGAGTGRKTTARQILIDYSDEPDWAMDKELELSKAQILMAGSQGYRHMYYPAWDWHLPWLFLPQGVAPQRAEHFYELAKQAISKGDLYWGFRFLARVIHYIEDLGQPYHTTQTSLRFIIPTSPIAGTTQTTKNYHFAYESYVGYRMQQEVAGLIPADYTTTLKQTLAIKVNSTAELLKIMARANNKHTSDTFRTSVNLFGTELRSKQKVPLTQTKVDAMMDHPARDEFDRTVHQTLQLTGVGVLDFMEYARQELFNGYN